jgi:hypothetical protein
MTTYTHAGSYTPAIGRINQEDIGKLALRIALGVLILFHGVAKLTGGIDFITEVVVKGARRGTAWAGQIQCRCAAGRSCCRSGELNSGDAHENRNHWRRQCR